jgi:hypothetical protein
LSCSNPFTSSQTNSPRSLAIQCSQLVYILFIHFLLYRSQISVFVADNSGVLICNKILTFRGFFIQLFNDTVNRWTDRAVVDRWRNWVCSTGEMTLTG